MTTFFLWLKDARGFQSPTGLIPSSLRLARGTFLTYLCPTVWLHLSCPSRILYSYLNKPVLLPWWSDPWMNMPFPLSAALPSSSTRCLLQDLPKSAHKLAPWLLSWVRRVLHAAPATCVYHSQGVDPPAGLHGWRVSNPSAGHIYSPISFWKHLAQYRCLYWVQ